MIPSHVRRCVSAPSPFTVARNFVACGVESENLLKASRTKATTLQRPLSTWALRRPPPSPLSSLYALSPPPQAQPQLRLQTQTHFIHSTSTTPSSTPHADLGESFVKPPPTSVPEGAVKYRYVRSSGPGGQNVNKVSTACEARFVVSAAEWLPMEVRARLAENEKNRINHDGELVIFAQEERTQARNRARCDERILEMVSNAWEAPKSRVIDETPSEKDKQRWKTEKRERHKIKEMRRAKDDWA